MSAVAPPSDDQPTVRGLAAGQRVFGRFVLQRLLGRGGMGAVWLARDETLGVEVALKFLHDAVRWDVAALAALRAETRRARDLTHPHVVRIHDFHEDAAWAAFSMEYMAGGSLHQCRAGRTPPVFTCAEIAAWLPGLCAGIDHAHAQGVVHRDLKPSNFLRTADGAVKISDFGIAQPLFETSLRLSQWAPSGTLAYMSPQQQFGEAPAPADDVYALGATLYELITGKPPFYTGNLAAQIERRVPDSLAARRRQLGVQGETIPREWEEAVVACLAKRPEDRPHTAGEVAARLSAPRDQPGRRRKFVTYYVTNFRAWRMPGLTLVVAVLGLATWSQWGGSPEAEPVTMGTAPTGFASDATRAYAAWNFDGDGHEASGRDWHMEISRTMATEDRFGRIDRALLLNGNTAVYRDNLPPDGWRADRPFALALWVRPESVNTQGATLLSLRPDRQEDLYIDLGLDHNRLFLMIGRIQVDTPDRVASDQTIPVGRWSHLVAMGDGRTLRLYLDGREVAAAPIGRSRTAAMTAPPSLRVGHQHKFDPQRFAGAVDELRLWQRVLTAEEIAQLAAAEAPPRFRPTRGVYADTDDLAAAAVREFGPAASLADWVELQRWSRDDTAAFCDAIGMVVNGAGPYLQNAGQRHSKPPRQYHLSRFDGRKPGYYLAHEELGGMTLALGSWFGSAAHVLARLPAEPPVRETLRAGTGRSVQRDLPGPSAPVALALHWRQEIPFGGEAGGADCELALRDGRRMIARCVPTADGMFALALGDATQPRLSRQVAATYGPLAFSVVVRGERLYFRARSQLGANTVLQEEIPAGFTMAEVVRVTVAGVDSAELVMEN